MSRCRCYQGRQASVLLGRLRDDPHWPVMDAAERYHELPFSMPGDRRPSTGPIDLLYRTLGGEHGAWHIVDFKADPVSDVDRLESLVEDYRQPLREYRHAVGRALGGEVETTLCFMDFWAAVRWEGVN